MVKFGVDICFWKNEEFLSFLAMETNTERSSKIFLINIRSKFKSFLTKPGLVWSLNNIIIVNGWVSTLLIWRLGII